MTTPTSTTSEPWSYTGSASSTTTSNPATGDLTTDTPVPPYAAPSIEIGTAASQEIPGTPTTPAITAQSTTSTPAVPITPAGTPATHGELASTGVNLVWLIIIAGALLLGGVALLGRKPKGPHHD